MTSSITSGNLTLSPAGAHLISADSPSGEILFLSSASEFGEGHAIRGGVPIIAPWFGGLLGLDPAHGWARRSVWDVSEGEALTATYGQDGLLLNVQVNSTDNGFEISLRLSNKTDEVRTSQIAFHPYFKVSDVESIEVEGFDGIDILDRLNDDTSAQNGPITFSGQYDRIALGTPVAIIKDKNRTITVEGSGHDSTVVWNPGAERASEMPDIGAGEWRDFVCIEPALLGANQQGVQVPPGESIEIAMKVSVS